MKQYKDLLSDREYMPVYYQKPNGKKVLYCEKCNIELDEFTEHCYDCQVCISGMDHHCVFYSKCIGQGNVNAFWATIAVLIFNFFLMGGLAMKYGDFDI